MKFSALLTLISTAPLWAQGTVLNSIPTRQFGHALLTNPLITAAPNLVEGGEFNMPSSMALDTTSNPPILYVSDTANHRVLAFRDPAGLATAAIANKVIGQANLFATFAGGPDSGWLVKEGLNQPTGIAVDAAGNLYVSDSGNNRILRFPKPVEQLVSPVVPDLVIGQPSFTSGTAANQGQVKPTEKTLAFYRGSPGVTGLAVDAAGNLWVADSLNNRVLRFPASQLTAGTLEPAADLVLGQPGFITDDPSPFQQTNLSGMNLPGDLEFDSLGRLYVSDSLSRVLYFPVQSSGGAAARVLGVQPDAPQGQSKPPYPTEYTLGAAAGGTPRCLFTAGTILFVCDTPSNRIVRYSSPEAWPAATPEAPSPPAIAVYGQVNFTSGLANRGLPQPANNSFSTPSGGAILGNALWIVDAGNYRVLGFPSDPGFGFTSATALLGQAVFHAEAPNSLDGRDLFVNGARDGVTFRGGGMAVDRASTPNHFYIADTGNHRILGFRDVRNVGGAAGAVLADKADVVIGQADLFSSTVNYPGGNAQIPTDRGLRFPSSVAVDASGNLYVADSGNGRVLRFPTPFAQPPGFLHRADLVLGQGTFVSKSLDATSFTMNSPYGLGFFSDGTLAVSDNVHNRVLLFRKTGDFSNGQAASVVLGQANFTSTGAAAGAGLSGPRGIAVDTTNRLYVTDTANSRLVIYSDTANIANGALGTVLSGLTTPEGVVVNPTTGEIWVAHYIANRLLRYPDFAHLLPDSAPTAESIAPLPAAVVMDPSGNIILTEGTNRATFYFSRLFYRHGATFASSVPLTPNLITLVARVGKNFEFTTDHATALPLPTTLAGIQVLVNGVPAPIFHVDPQVIYFIIPNGAPTSGTAEFVVLRPETGEILAAAGFPMGPAIPGFFAVNQQGTQQVVATHHADNSVNGPNNRIGQDELLTLWLTGFGHIPNLPPDGAAPGAAISTPVLPAIFINGGRIADSKILYSGVSPEFPGLWQLNIRIPKTGESGAPPPGANISILLQMTEIPSNVGGTQQIGGDRFLTIPNGLITTIAVK